MTRCLYRESAIRVAGLALAALGLIAACGDARSPSSLEAHVHPASAATQPSGAEQQALVVLSDAPMLDQSGAQRQLRSDVIGSRIVVVDFIFTSCQTICPVTTALLAQAKGRLADIPADDLVFVSLSVDSQVDTPQRLAAFAASQGADWTFLTGEKPVMDEALTWLNAYATNPENHAAMILIGDASSDKFSRIYGMPDPVFVERRVRELAAARSEGTSHHAH